MASTRQRVKYFITRYIVGRSAVSMWRKRAKLYGARAALNIGHSEEEIEGVTTMQRDAIFPILKQELTGREKTVLDYGCGPGRFTRDLARLVDGNAIGVDPIQHFLDIAPRNENVEYRAMKKRAIPVADRSVDIVWICLVFGGIIKDRVLKYTVREIDRVLKHGGIIALIENTTDIPNTRYWAFRPVEYYQALFMAHDLKCRGEYYDLGQRISVMVGQKR